MNSLVTKLRALERRLSSERGEFNFFGLLLRDESPGKWDLVVSANWLDPEKRQSTKLIDEELAQALALPEKLLLSRIVILDPEGQMLDALLSKFSVRHGLQEARSESFQDMQFEHLYVFSAGRDRVPESSKAS